MTAMSRPTTTRSRWRSGTEIQKALQGKSTAAEALKEAESLVAAIVKKRG